MKKFFLTLVFLLTIFACKTENANLSNATVLQPDEQTYKPWAYWWWMGSSVTKEGISENLKAYQKAGFGGLHIIPIYGEKGDENNYIDYLSPLWMDMLVHTLNEAEKLGLGIDMTTGTGWPFGGPNISFNTSAKKIELKKVDLSKVVKLTDITKGIKGGKLIALSVKTENGFYKNILNKINTTSDLSFFKTDKNAIALILLPTRQKVKRAAPGAKGLVMDYFSEKAINHYFSKFKTAFDSTEFTGAKVRSFYNDSYEVYKANSTDNFLRAFEKNRLYDFSSVLHKFAYGDDLETKERILTDYCETISELLLQNFTLEWDAKSNAMGMLTRNQAHGSPGNLLDLYAAVDIPETESFGVSNFTIPGLRQDPDFEEERFGRPNPLTMKFASSAAHIYGKKLVSSETATWLGDHFKVALSQVKPQVDELFTAGINHVFYHGITYNPPKKPFPGRLFYASTNFGTKAHFWEELPALNRYIENCQRILQNTQPNNDVLVYFPIHDAWAKNKSDEIILRFDVHHAEKWLDDSNFGKLIKNLWDTGFTFDYISDKMLEKARFSNGKVVLNGGDYKTIVVPTTKYMPTKTLEKLHTLAKKGAKIIFQDKLPVSVPGYYNLANRIEAFETIKSKLRARVEQSQNIEKSLLKYGVINETIASKGLTFIKKQRQGETVYFITNLSNKFKQGKIALATSAKNIVLLDPLTNEKHKITSKIVSGNTEINLQLAPGKSCFLTCNNSATTIPIREDYKTSKNAIKIDANWKITPKSDERELPKEIHTSKLSSWTNFSDAWSIYSGKAVYTASFDLNTALVGKEMLLDLGDVRETARVKINGKDLGLLWCIPYKTIIPKNVLQKKNTLSIEVTNLSFNKVIDLDRKKTPWKNFNEINFVNIKYEKYDAGDKAPVLSGLLTDLMLYSIEKNTSKN